MNFAVGIIFIVNFAQPLLSPAESTSFCLNSKYKQISVKREMGVTGEGLEGRVGGKRSEEWGLVKGKIEYDFSPPRLLHKPIPYTTTTTNATIMPASKRNIE